MNHKSLPFGVLAVALLLAACVNAEPVALDQKPAVAAVASADNLITSLATMLGNGVGFTQKVTQGLESAASELGFESGRVSDALSAFSGRATAVGSKAFGGVNNAAERVAALIKTPFQRENGIARQRFESARLNDRYLESEDGAEDEEYQESSLEKAAEHQALQHALSSRRQAEQAKQQAIKQQQQAEQAAEREAEKMEKRMERANSRRSQSLRHERVSHISSSSSKRKGRSTARSMSNSHAKRVSVNQMRRKSVSYRE